MIILRWAPALHGIKLEGNQVYMINVHFDGPINIILEIKETHLWHNRWLLLNAAHASQIKIAACLLFVYYDSPIIFVPSVTIALTTWSPYPIGARYLPTREEATLQT